MNRRAQTRSSQSGQIIMTTSHGQQIKTDLHDISDTGLGALVGYGDSKTLSVRDKVTFKCSWNPRLLSGKYVIRSISGNRIGLQDAAVRNY